MKKTISILLVMIMCFSTLVITGCSNAKNSTNDTSNTDDANESKTTIESALAFYTEVWAAFGEDNKFSCAGGDMDHIAEGPGQFLLTEDNANSFKELIHVTDELYDMLENDAATLQHMMNTNTFSSAVVKLKDPTKASEFAEAYKTAIQGQQWMCGFPDKVVVISVGDYVVMAYGLEVNIDNLVAACSAVEAQSTVLVDAPAMVE
ncbi:MAG: hypothetical protein HFI75_04075 [Lachnospiraceae bacterium]|nr:hypothetical protein [Lachnospiraceae bacterium]